MVVQRFLILGIPIDVVTMDEAVQRILLCRRGSAQCHVMTPNPEMLVAASRDAEFRSVLQRSTLNLADGTGLLWAARVMGASLPERVAGVDLMEQLCRHPAVGPIFLLGAQPGVAEQAAARLRAACPDLVIAGTAAGSPSDDDAPALCAQIRSSGAATLFVAYGAPAQDLWIDRFLRDLPDVRVAMGVGGAFDFLAGVRTRAPRWLQRLGLEWVWRLCLQPWRFLRILRATVLFPALVLRERWIHGAPRA